MSRSVTTLLLPGVGNSGPEHWQSLWEALHHDFHRVLQNDWDHPDLDAWCRNLEAAVHDATSPVVLVAHSLGCLLVAQWAQRTALTVQGALLVAPPDPQSAPFPAEAVGFGRVPMTPLPFTSILVSSSNDPYGTPEFSRNCAAAWGSRLIEAGPLGHINAASGLGEWRQGVGYYEDLLRSI
jgi:predicted alpha/beta hydrolase family esterase